MYQNMKRIRTICIFILVLCFNFLRSQNYPVHLTTIITPPFSGYLSDYTSVGNQNLKLIVLFNDFTKPSYNIKLKFKLAGQNINIESKNFYYEGPYTLIPGVPLEINGSDIAGLLNSNNLDFSGLSKQQYETGKILPEGLYTLTFTAFDFNNPTAIQVSNQSSFSAWMMLNDPPYLNMPFCGSVQNVINPQNIIFQWTSMNLTSPNSVNSTEYEFSLYEVRPKGANPNNILQTLPPIYQTTTNITTLNYGITEPVLNLGMDYVWRVKAIDQTGRDLFKNQGYSQLCTFTYGNMTQFIDSSSLALTLQGIPINYRMAKCFWDTMNVYKSYRLYYRKQNGTNWFTNSNIQRSYDHIQNLEPNNTYQAYIKGVLLDNSEGPASNTVTIVTPPKTEYVCGQAPGIPPTQNKPLTLASVGQIWEVGQFEVAITSINNPVSPIGQYSGYGKVAIPFLGNANFNVKFNNVFVNEEYQVIAGRIDVITEGLNAWLHNIDIANAEQNATYINGTITGFSVTGSQYCYTLAATNTQVCDTLPSSGNVMVVRDEDGNQYTIQLKPPPPHVTGPTSYLHYSSDNLDASDSAMVTFNASATQNFGFDKKEYAAFTGNYEVIKLKNSKNYFVSNKSIGENQTDEVLAQVQVVNFSAGSLSFKTEGGTILNSQSLGNNSYKISGVDASANGICAWYNNKKIGKLNIVSLKSLTKKVVLVPVNNANVSVNNTQLNDIFKQANVSWNVTIAPNFNFNLGQDGLEAADANLMSKYSPEMRALRDAYKQFDSLYDKSAYYIFVIPNFTDQNLKGYMVRGRALGFITSNVSIKEIAHELGHGAFALEHTFPQLAKNTSNNLMDYSQGVQMAKEQWIKIQTSKILFDWLDNEEDASLFITQRQDLLKILLEIKKGYKTNSTINIGTYTSVMSIGKTYLNGIDYDNITTIIMPYVQTLGVVTPNNNNITTSSFNSAYPNQGVAKPCIDIGGKIKIFVPPNRLENMKIFLKSSAQLRNMLLFVNGYRDLSSFDGSELSGFLEVEKTNNTVNQADLFNYWAGIDQKFSLRIGTKNLVYADGHHSVSTSNHGSVPRFLRAMSKSDNRREFCSGIQPGDDEYCYVENNDSPLDVDFLHTSPMNEGGFNLRRTNGKLAGDDFVTNINNGTFDFDKNTDTLDIVAHSMGYAYSLGMIEKIQAAGIKLGRFYIIAPENACSGGMNWKCFTEVWQYGSNLGQPGNDPMYLQDGVAPQCECSNLVISNGQLNSGNNKPIKTGRIAIPQSITTKGFVGSHSIRNYGWILDIGETDQTGGYVKPRN